MHGVVRSSAAVISFAVLIALGVSPASAVVDPCSFSNDKTNPTISSIEIAPVLVITGLVKQTVTATIAASDNCGVSRLDLILNPVGNVTGGRIALYDFTLMSGTSQSGTWQASTVLSDYLKGGDYEATEVNVSDVSYNSLAVVYPVANLLSAREATTTTMQAQSLRADGSVVLYGRVTVSAFSDPAGPLELQTRSHSGPWVRVFDLPHDTYGSFTVAVKATRNSQYRTVYAGDGKTATSTSAAVGVLVTPAVTVRASAARVPVGRTVVLSGTVRPALAGQIVVLQRLKGKLWVKVSAARLTAASAYRFTMRMSTRGASVYRVVKTADRDRLLGASRAVRVTVG